MLKYITIILFSLILLGCNKKVKFVNDCTIQKKLITEQEQTINELTSSNETNKKLITELQSNVKELSEMNKNLIKKNNLLDTKNKEILRQYNKCSDDLHTLDDDYEKITETANTEIAELEQHIKDLNKFYYHIPKTVVDSIYITEKEQLLVVTNALENLPENEIDDAIIYSELKGNFDGRIKYYEKIIIIKD